MLWTQVATALEGLNKGSPAERKHLSPNPKHVKRIQPPSTLLKGPPFQIGHLPSNLLNVPPVKRDHLRYTSLRKVKKYPSCQTSSLDHLFKETNVVKTPVKSDHLPSNLVKEPHVKRDLLRQTSLGKARIIHLPSNLLYGPLVTRPLASNLLKKPHIKRNHLPSKLLKRHQLKEDTCHQILRNHS